MTEILLSEKMKADGMLKDYYVYNIFIDGKTGEILLDDKDVFEEGS